MGAFGILICIVVVGGVVFLASKATRAFWRRLRQYSAAKAPIGDRVPAAIGLWLSASVAVGLTVGAISGLASF
jgi:hypothetical protein